MWGRDEQSCRSTGSKVGCKVQDSLLFSIFDLPTAVLALGSPHMCPYIMGLDGGRHTDLTSSHLSWPGFG